MNAATVVGVAGFLLLPAWWVSIHVRRLVRVVSVRVARVIGPCSSCGWPVARGHRSDCTRR